MSPWSSRIWGAGMVRTTRSNCSGEPVSLETSHLLFFRLIWVTHCLKKISAPAPKAKSGPCYQDFPYKWWGNEKQKSIHLGEQIAPNLIFCVASFFSLYSIVFTPLTTCTPRPPINIRYEGNNYTTILHWLLLLLNPFLLLLHGQLSLKIC